MSAEIEEGSVITYGELISLLQALVKKAANYNETTFEDFMEEGYFCAFLDYLATNPPDKTITFANVKNKSNLTVSMSEGSVKNTV